MDKRTFIKNSSLLVGTAIFHPILSCTPKKPVETITPERLKNWAENFEFSTANVHYPKTYPAAWEYGFDQLVPYLEEIKGEYEKVYDTDKYDQPYIIFLFYLKYPPEKFQKEVKLTPRDKFGFSTVRNFDKFHFEAVNGDELKTKSNILVVGTTEEINTSATILKRIYFKNGQTAFLVVQV